LAQFTRAIEIAPDFAEAWNQRATVHYLNERYEQSIRDAAHAVQLNPDHFGAWAGIGHCHAHLGRFDEAISAYQKALSIHPRLECLEEAIGTMRERKRQHD
jgi:tetratricopeptide (TPR) repeat protein